MSDQDLPFPGDEHSFDAPKPEITPTSEIIEETLLAEIEKPDFGERVKKKLREVSDEIWDAHMSTLQDGILVRMEEHFDTVVRQHIAALLRGNMSTLKLLFNERPTTERWARSLFALHDGTVSEYASEMVRLREDIVRSCAETLVTDYVRDQQIWAALAQIEIKRLHRELLDTQDRVRFLNREVYDRDQEISRLNARLARAQNTENGE